MIIAEMLVIQNNYYWGPVLMLIGVALGAVSIPSNIRGWIVPTWARALTWAAIVTLLLSGITIQAVSKKFVGKQTGTVAPHGLEHIGPNGFVSSMFVAKRANDLNGLEIQGCEYYPEIKTKVCCPWQTQMYFYPTPGNPEHLLFGCFPSGLWQAMPGQPPTLPQPPLVQSHT